MISAYELFLIDHEIYRCETEAERTRQRSEQAQLAAIFSLLKPAATPSPESRHQTTGFAEIMSVIAGISTAIDADAQVRELDELRDKLVRYRLTQLQTMQCEP